LPKVDEVDKERMISLNVTSDLESDLIGDLFGCGLDQINQRPNKNGTFLDLVFANVSVDMAVEGAETHLLKLECHHKAYEIEMQICCCKFEAMEFGVKRYILKLADCVANWRIVDELDAVDWCSLFSGRGVDLCVDLFYEAVWRSFERHVPTRYSGCEQKLPWMTRELTSLKNNKAKASKKPKDSEKREYEGVSAERSISSSMVEQTMITAQESRRRSRAIRRPFLDM
jgi:hypothetical protein